MSTQRATFALTLICSALLTACGGGGGGSSDEDNTPAEVSKSVQFSAAVNGQAFNCGTTYDNVGTGVGHAGRYQATDLRFYVHDVSLINAKGESVNVALNQDGQWQYQNLALIDLENGCRNGTPEMNSQVIGTVPEASYQGMCFTLGVPFNLNHIDDKTAQPPLNASSMLWSWTTGRKFLRLDGTGDPALVAGEGANNAFHMHLGSTGCTASNGAGTAPASECATPNRVRICFDTFNVDTQQVQLDIGRLLAGSNVTSSTPQTAPGCMSSNSDPECTAIIPRLGLDFVYQDGSNAPQTYPAAQSTFSAVNR